VDFREILHHRLKQSPETAQGLNAQSHPKPKPKVQLTSGMNQPSNVMNRTFGDGDLQHGEFFLGI